MNKEQLRKAIEQNGRISSSHYLQAARRMRGAGATRPVREMVTKTGRKSGKADETIGSAPEGFGHSFFWDRDAEQIALVIFLNAADPLGVSITGLKLSDLVEVTAASGICSFDESDGNEFAASLIGLVGEGAKGAVSALGAPEAAPFIDLASKFAQEQFRGKEGEKKMRRDPYGEDPGTGHQARGEGGVLVSMPSSGGPAYSGNGDHKERWLKGHKPRRDDQLPAHVQGRGFFLVRGDSRHNARTVARDDEPLFLTPWDWKFEDNAGFYKLFVRITKANGDGPIVD